MIKTAYLLTFLFYSMLLPTFRIPPRQNQIVTSAFELPPESARLEGDWNSLKGSPRVLD